MSKLLLLVAMFIGWLDAQVPAPSAWQGEWGSYKEAMAKGEMHAEGQRLAIHSCLGQTCQVTVTTSTLAGENCDGSGQLQIDSATQAIATLKPPFADPKNECVLSLNLIGSGNQRRVEIKKKSGNCGFYCTPKCTFEHAFLFRSANRFYGDDIPGCFLARSKALDAVCSDKALADLQQSWMSLVDETDNLFTKPSHARQARDQAQATCSQSEDPSGCLRAFFKTDGDRLTKVKARWQTGVTEPGDPKEAARKAAAIAGTYAHSFQNRTVQGDRYRSTDQLEIKSSANSQIYFKVHLDFFNGHQCSVEGTAAYKKNGAFVYRSSDTGESCVLEIFAREKGVEFQDPVGGCKAYCGARGSLSGANFPYSERKDTAR